MKKIFSIFLITALCAIQTNDFASAKGRKDFEKTGNVVWEISTKEKMVAITFDDGPHPVFTPLILDTLAKYHAKGTFFVTGKKAKEYPDILRREVNEGHEVGNHTYHHFNNHISDETLTSELKQTDRVIQGIIGYKPTLYRPVGGNYDEGIVTTAVKNGKMVILWSWHQDPRDWNNPPAGKITRHVTSAVKPGDIIVLHDWHNNETAKTCQTVLELDSILSFLTKNGYKCVTVSEMLYRSKIKAPEPFSPFH